MEASKLVRTMAATTQGVAITGSAAAVVIAFFAALASKLGIAFFLVATAAAWWAIWGGLAWGLHRNADRLRDDDDRKEFASPRIRPTAHLR